MNDNFIVFSIFILGLGFGWFIGFLMGMQNMQNHFESELKTAKFQQVIKTDTTYKIINF